MHEQTISRTDRRGLWRSRWAAVGAAVAVTLGGGGLFIAEAAGGVESSVVLTDPVRILDSRDTVDVGLDGPFVSAVSQKLQVTGEIPTTTGTKTVVPDGATGVLMNVTAVNASADGFVSVRPGDAVGSPSTSSLNVTAGVVVPNAVTIALPTAGANAGEIEITWNAYGVVGPTTDILVDVVGYTTAVDAPPPATAPPASEPTDVVMHDSPLFTPTQSSGVNINVQVDSSVLLGAGDVVAALEGPLLLDGADYRLSEVEYCIVGIGAGAPDGFVAAVEVRGRQGAAAFESLGTDDTDQTAVGCYTLAVDESPSNSYWFTLSVGGAGSVSIGSLNSTWTPV